MISKMKLRFPILPLDGSIGNQVKDISVIFDYMNVTTISKQKKYLERMRYRTTPLFGMSNECYIQNGVMQSKFEVNDLQFYNLEYSFTGKLAVNSLISSNNKYFIVENNKEVSRIERSMLDKIFQCINHKNRVYIDQLVHLLTKEYCGGELSEDKALDIINELIGAGFLIPEYEELESVNSCGSEGILFRPINTRCINVPQITNRDLNILSSFLSRLLPQRTISTYSELLEYFMDTYSINKIRFSDLIRDKNFVRIARDVLKRSNEYQGEIAWHGYLMDRIDAYHITNDKKFVELDTREFNFSKSSNFSIDVVTTMITEDSSVLLNLDNSKPLYKLFSINADTKFSENRYSINYISSDRTIDFFLRNKYSNRINVNFCSSSTLGIDLSDIYITIDLSHNRFIVVDSNNNALNISLNSTLNIALLDETCQLLLMLSDVDNIPFNFLPDFSETFDYLPRVTVDNKLIIYREQLFIKNNKLVFNSAEAVKESIIYNIDNSIANLFCYAKDDVEIFIDLTDESIFKYLFKELKKYGVLCIKEDIQEKSCLLIDNKQYANEIVMSLKRGEEHYGNYRDIPILNTVKDVDTLDKWIFFEIVLDNFIDNVLEVMAELMRKKIEFFYIFYVNDDGEKVLRLRCKNIEKISEILRILKKGNLKDFIIKPYIKETGRYYNMGIDKFEDFSCKDSVRILKTLLNTIDFDSLSETNIYELVLENTIYLFDHFGLSLYERFKILKFYLIGKEDRQKTEKVARIIESALDSVHRFNSLDNYFEADYMSLIHTSNIRLVGNVPKLENEIYKYLAIYYRKIIFINEGKLNE